MAVTEEEGTRTSLTLHPFFFCFSTVVSKRVLVVAGGRGEEGGAVESVWAKKVNSGRGSRRVRE